MNATEMLASELTRAHTTPRADRETRHRAAALGSRRQARRHRLAEKVRSVADRLDV